MRENKCICCGEVIPKGREMCIGCERDILYIGMILQSNNATKDEVRKAYDFVYNKEEQSGCN